MLFINCNCHCRRWVAPKAADPTYSPVNGSTELGLAGYGYGWEGGFGPFPVFGGV